MNRKRFFAISWVLVAVTLLSPTFAGADTIEDSEPPQLAGLSIEPDEVDTTGSDQKVTFTAHVTDNLAGVSSVGIALSSPSGGQVIVEGLSFLSGTATDALYSGSVTIPRFAEAGAWKITNVFLNDNARNGTGLSTAKLEELGLPNTVQVESVEDSEPPQLAGLSIEPDEVDTTGSDQKVAFTAHVTDNLAGVSSVGIALSSPSGGQVIVEGLSFLSGTATDALYSGSVTIPRFAEAGAWKITNVFLNDNARNGTGLSTAKLEELGLPNTVQVESVEDSEPPQLAGLSIEPDEVDTTGSDQKVAFTAHVTDNLAGVSSVGIALSSPSGGQVIVEGLSFLSGTATDALYSGSVTIPASPRPAPGRSPTSS